MGGLTTMAKNTGRGSTRQNADGRINQFREAKSHGGEFDTKVAAEQLLCLAHETRRGVLVWPRRHGKSQALENLQRWYEEGRD